MTNPRQTPGLGLAAFWNLVTLADKNTALERLSKYLGMFVERKRLGIVESGVPNS
jgi:hypothetical protein